MNFFGIGTLELLVILAVAFVALGPGKTVEVARTIGKMAREARRTFTEIMDAASVDERESGSRSSSGRDAPPSPPSEPMSTPPHLSAQVTPPADISPDDGPPENRPSDSR